MFKKEKGSMLWLEWPAGENQSQEMKLDVLGQVGCGQDFELCSECDDEPLEDFVQGVGMIWFTRLSGYSGCCLAGGENGKK